MCAGLEVAGSCFCCNFDALTATVEGLGAGNLPDIIIAEPVGSCTDLVATVIRPLTEVYGAPLDIAPFGVILKPSHGLRILKGDSGSGFSPKANYIFRKQIEEADFVVINRIDELPTEQVDELQGLIDAHYPGRPVLRASARTGAGFEAVIAMLEQRGPFGQRVMEVDYDVYAAGEAELGWLNSQVTLNAPDEFSLDDLLLDLIGRLHGQLLTTDSETAHLKVIGLCDVSYAVANLVSNATGPELSLGSSARTKEANVVVNARVATDPAQLEAIVRNELAVICRERGLSFNVVSLQSFRPGRPVPTHRMP